jgi:hypothetical protein
VRPYKELPGFRVHELFHSGFYNLVAEIGRCLAKPPFLIVVAQGGWNDVEKDDMHPHSGKQPRYAGAHRTRAKDGNFAYRIHHKLFSCHCSAFTWDG